MDTQRPLHGRWRGGRMPAQRSDLKRPALVPRAFGGPAEFCAWLVEHHARATELLVRCFKARASHRGMTYRQALDEALCMGWIDGVRRSLDAFFQTQPPWYRRTGAFWVMSAKRPGAAGAGRRR